MNLNAQGQRTAGPKENKPFGNSSIRGILTNRFYVGELPDGRGGYIPAKHKPFIDQLKQDLDKGNITLEQYSKEIIPKTRDIRYQGTAVFVIHHGRRYLLTARHVLWDKQSAKREYQEEEGRAQQWPEDIRLSLLQSAEERELNRIFGIIFRVPSLDEVIKNRGIISEFLMNLGAGVSSLAPYTFSAPDLDQLLRKTD